VSHTPTRDFLRDAIRAGRRDDCARCQFPYTCSTHAAEAVLDACRREDLFIMERSTADALFEQAPRGTNAAEHREPPPSGVDGYAPTGRGEVEP
jgi:hypothetical protein